MCSKEVGREGKKDIDLPTIQVGREGSKKVVWKNFSEVCRRLKRTPEEFKAFILEEFMTEGSLNSDGGFVIKGKYQARDIENVIIRYVSQFVRCIVCQSLDTELVKENRITFIKCHTCSSKNSVALNKKKHQGQAK